MKNTSAFVFIWIGLFTQAFCDNKNGYCGKVRPKKDTNWTELVGDWYNLMFMSGVASFVNCRKMKISNVDTKEKTLDIDFEDIVYTSHSQRFREDFIYFRWFDEPGVIYTAIKTDNEFWKFKTDKFSIKKKSPFEHLTKESKDFCHTLVSTDHASYMILIQCKQNGDPLVWVSIKNTDLDIRLADKIKAELLKVGIDSGTMDNSATEACNDH